MSLSFVSIIKLTMKMALVYKATVFTVHKVSHSSCGAYGDYKGCYFFLDKYQAYEIYYLYFKITPSL